MKKLLLPFLLALSGASFQQVLAQPTLTAASNNLITGNQFQARQLTVGAPEFTSAATAGANQTWNFSSVTSTGAIPAGVLSRAAAPNPNSLPTANLVVRAGDEYSYLESSATSLKEHGAYQAQQNYSLENTDPAEKMRFPFTFNSTFTDSYSGAANLGGTMLPRVGTVTVTGEGYGTLITPTGTYQNVLKVKTEEISNPATLYSETSLTYDWFQAGVHFPVMRMTRRVTLAGTIHTGFFLDQAMGTKEEMAAAMNLQIFPNPASSSVQVQFENAGRAPIKLSLVNLVGQQIAELGFEEMAGEKKTLKTDVSKYPKGIYLLKLETDANTVFQRLVIQ